LDDRLALSVTHPDGRVTRWGPDEPTATEIPGDLTFGTSLPGGDKDLTCSLLRRIDLNYADQGLFDEVRLYGPGNRGVWRGKMAQFPRSHGQGFGITPGAVGLSSLLDRQRGFREIYVDRDLGKWGPASVQRRLNTLGTYSIVDPVVTPDTTTGQASLASTFRDTWLNVTRPLSESYYDARNIPIGSLYYAWKKNANVSSADANWNWHVRIGSDDILTSIDSSGNLRAAGPSTGTLAATGTKIFAVVQHYYDAGPGGGANSEYAIYWTCLAVYGTHGLTKQGTDSATSAKGFYASDVIQDIVERAAPDLTIGDIEATTFAIPHLVFADPTRASDAIAAVNAYHLYDWGVYDGEFFYRATDPDRLTWQARLDQGAHLDLDGDTAAQVFNGVLVRFNDPLGKPRIAGPLAVDWDGGVALCDSDPNPAIDALRINLVDRTATNPLNAWGEKAWGELNIGFPTTYEGAIAIGAAWLAERSLAQRRGSLTLTGTVTHPTEGEVPVWRVRAGDYVSISDHPATVARRVIETRYTHGSRQNVLSLDNTNFKLESILERLGVQLMGVI
jgi:hypothetical protein